MGGGEEEGDDLREDAREEDEGECLGEEGKTLLIGLPFRML